MFIKRIVIILAMLVVALAEIRYEQATKRCYSQSDCDPVLECCSKRIFEDEAFCVQRRRLNEICLDNGMSNTLYNGIYDMSCPCLDGLECRKEITTVNGLTRSPNPRCVPTPSRFFYSYYPVVADSVPYSFGDMGGSRATAGSNSYSSAEDYNPYYEENTGARSYSYSNRKRRAVSTAEKK